MDLGKDNANIEAQAVGKTPEVCAPNSNFQSYYKACKYCIETYDDSGEADRDYLDPIFSQWIDYCDEVQSSPPSPMQTPPPTASSLVENIVVVTIPYTGTIDGVKTILSLEKTVTSFAPRLDTTVITIETSQDGHYTVWTFTKSFTHLANDALTSILQSTPSLTVTQNISTSTPHISEVTASNPIATAKSESTQSSRAWVAGTVVGGVAGIAILFIVAWALFRSKRNRNSKLKGHELHGESVLKSELEVKPEPQELDAEEQRKQPAELPSNTF
ncbi:hypothetical protein F4801DRAFT_583366 [Xylaria longipes]|nr:hypothetical protein F4801DRAFT_583366 [Xylaria longipes]